MSKDGGEAGGQCLSASLISLQLQDSLVIPKDF